MIKILIIAIICVIVGLLMGYFYAKHQPVAPLSQSDALSISRTGSFKLDRAPEDALPLFTAQGEKLWISVWKPTILKGDGFEKGTIFVTSNHGHTTYWRVMDYNTKTYYVLYSRVTPGMDMGTVEVSLDLRDDGGSVVNVSYELTGLSRDGNKSLEDGFSKEKYAHMMQNWMHMINESRETIDAYFSNKK